MIKAIHDLNDTEIAAAMVPFAASWRRARISILRCYH